MSLPSSTEPATEIKAKTPRSIRSRLWLGGYGSALFLGMMVIGNLFISPDRSVSMNMLGLDFVAFYTGGSFVRNGDSRQLYNIDAVGKFEQDLAHRENIDLGKAIGPWWNPPFYALVFVPLAGLPFHQALDVWLAINLIALAAAIMLLCRMLIAPPRDESGMPNRLSDWRNWGLVPLLMIASMPFLQGFSHGQNTFTSLLLLTATVAAWRSNRAILAGAIGGLLFYKPQLGAVVAVVMALTLGWRAIAGVAITGTVLLLINLLALPGTLGDFLHKLPANVYTMQIAHDYLWERHVTLKAFWRLLLQGRKADEPTLLLTFCYGLCDLIVGCGLLLAIRQYRKIAKTIGDPLGLARDRLIAATIAAMPLLMPFYFDYDLMLLAVSFVLLGRELLLRKPGKSDRRLAALSAIFFLWLFFNSAVALHTRVNLTVLIESAVAAQLIYRACRAGAMHNIADGDSAGDNSSTQPPAVGLRPVRAAA